MNFPSKCPYCNKDITEKNTGNNQLELGKTLYQTEIHQCFHCSNPIFVVRKSNLDELTQVYDYGNVIHYFPFKAPIKISEKIQELSPNGYNAYFQAIQAKESKYDMLVGAGLRIALEWLVWDYLIKIKGFTQKELEKINLAQRIEKMNCNDYSLICAKLVRLFGNDSVHVIKQIDFSVDEVIEAFEMLCGIIVSELNINNINARL